MSDSNQELEKLFGDRKYPKKVMFKRLYGYFKDQRVRLFVAFILMILSVVCEAAIPYLAKIVTEKLEVAEGQPFTGILTFVIAFLIMSILGQVFLYFQSMILQKAGQKVVYKMRMEVFSHIENMSQNQLNDMPVGALVTRVANYTQSVSELFTTILINLVKNFLTIIISASVLFFLNYKVAFVTLVFVALVFVYSLIFSNVIHSLFKEERRAFSDLNTFLSENLSGMKITQAFNQQVRKYKEFEGKSDYVRRIIFREIICFGVYRPFITLLYFSSVAVTFLLSKEFGVASATAYAIYLYLTRFFEPVQHIADQLNGVQKAITSSERLFSLLDVPPEVLDSEDAVDIDHFEGHIEFKNVWFAYNKDEWILKDVSFEIKPKETCAFVGATGAGKTTILSLIVRNYEIQKGQILIDGIDIKKIKIKSLRKAIGQMLQDVFLFSGTIKENITLHDESISDEEVVKACEYVNADKFINETEKGLYEEVIENGENYSQGQRQLLSFARTMVHKPQILILDEATANIDTETEVLIQDSLEKMKIVGTMLVVAHRLSTVQKADQIIVLQNGEVKEKGNHQQLLKQRGLYYKLYELQYQDN